MADFLKAAHKRLNSHEGLTKTTAELEASIVQFYTGGGLDQATIAELYGVTQSYVSKVLKKHKIPRNPPASYVPYKR